MTIFEPVHRRYAWQKLRQLAAPIMHPKYIAIRDFTYPLPQGRIASYPLAERDNAKLLIYQRGSITEDHYCNISEHVPENAFLVFNDTKVIPARLLFQKPSGGSIEIFCLEPGDQYPDMVSAMSQKKMVFWKCLIGGASKWKKGQLLEKRMTIGGTPCTLQAAYVEKKSNHFIIAFSWTAEGLSVAEIWHHAGLVPLPPYIKRKAEPADVERYQTIYARQDGSVAAPTAGLHFTENIFEKLVEKNIAWDFISLHVGAGTFQPVKTETLEQHDMHAEWMDISCATIGKIIGHAHKPLIAVGTTSLRALESLYWLGVKISLHQDIKKEMLAIDQWDAYELADGSIAAKKSLSVLLEWLNRNKLDRLVMKTRLLIAPGYQFKMISGLVTNFHQSQSTLLLLVSAWIGEDWKKVYQYALDNDFRFLSYGDGCLLFSKDGGI